MFWSPFPWHLFYQVAWSSCPAHLSFHGPPSKNPTTISHVILWDAVLAPILSHWSPPQSFQTGISYTALTSHCFDIPLLWYPIESLLSKKYITNNEFVWFDTVLAVSANRPWNMIWCYYVHNYGFFNWHNTSYDSWLILLIWHVTYVVLYDYLNSTMIWAMGSMDMIVWNVAVGHMVCSVMQDL